MISMLQANLIAVENVESQIALMWSAEIKYAEFR